MKTMLITFLDIKDTVYFEFITQGQTLNRDCYVEIRKRVHEAVRRKGLNFGPTIGFSTMTLLQVTGRSLSTSLWPWNRLLNWNTYPTTLIWLRVTSGCFQKKSALKKQRFRIQKTSKKMWRRYWKLFHNRHSKNISNSSSIIELSA